MQFLTTFSRMTFMAPPLPVRVQAITLKCWTNTTDPPTWIKHTNIVSFVLFLNNSGYWMLFVFNEIESNNYRLNEIWPTKLCIKNVIETGPYLRCQILLGIVRNGRSRKFVTKDLTHFPISPHALQIQISTIFQLIYISNIFRFLCWAFSFLLLLGSWIFSPPWTEVKRGGVFIKSLQVLTKYCCRQWCSVAALSYYGVKYDPRRRNWGGLLPLQPGLLLEKGERGKTGGEQSLKVNRPSKKQLNIF